MRVAIFMQDLKGGGAERVMANLACGLANAGVAVDMVLVRKSGPYLAMLPPTVRVVDLGTRRVVHSIPALVRYLRTERPAALISALVHVNTAAIIAGRIARTGTRIVVTEHNDVARDRAHTDSRTVTLAFRLMPFVYRWADRILAVSSGVAQSLAHAARVPRRRIEVVHNPAVTPTLRSQASQTCEHPWFAEGAPPVVLAVGRLEVQKDFATLIRAFARLRSRRVARLVILGEGSLRAELEQLVAESGLGADGQLPGFLQNPFPLIARAKVLALSSLWEGLPTVLIEALACGTSVVATDCPSGPAEILAGGCYGRLVPVGDVERLATALDQAIELPHDAQMLNRRANDFTVERVSAVYRDILLAGNAGTVVQQC